MHVLPDSILEQIARACIFPSQSSRRALPRPLRVATIEEADVTSFFAFAGVCRGTRAAASSCLRNLCFDRCHSGQCNEEGTSYVNRFRLVSLGGANLNSLELKSVAFEKQDHPCGLRKDMISGLRACLNLQTLCIKSCLGVERLLVECVDESDALGATFLPNLAHLLVEANRLASVKQFAESLVFSLARSQHWRSLVRLDLQALRYASLKSLTKLFSSGLESRLIHLRLGEPAHASPTEVCSLVAATCSKLESLELYLWSSMEGGSHELCKKLGSRLRHLTLSVCDWTGTDLLETTKSCRDLKSLTVTQCGIPSDSLVLGLLCDDPESLASPSTLQLERLTIAGQRDWSDAHLQKLSYNGSSGDEGSPIRSLSTLSIIACAKSLSSDGLLSAVRSCGRSIESLEIKGSYDIADHDSIQLLGNIESYVGSQFKHLILVGCLKDMPSVHTCEILKRLAPRLLTLDVPVRSQFASHR
jgi:hypothetical protein